MTWQTVYESFLNNPRDVKTTPKTNRTPLWFFVYAEDGDLYIENAKNHSNSSKITQRRKLDKNNFAKMTDLNDRRDRGFSVSKEATSVTVNQVYWFGIFHDLQQGLCSIGRTKTKSRCAETDKSKLSRKRVINYPKK